MARLWALVGRVVLSACMACVSGVALAEQILATATMTQSLSGSLNSIAGSTTLEGGQIHLPAGSTLTRIEFELLSFSTTPTLVMPQSLGISFRYTYPNTSITDNVGIAFSSLQGIQIGDIISIDPFALPLNFSNPILGIFDFFGQEIPILQASASWGFGGINASARSEIEVRAFGAPGPFLVPEPGTVGLVAIALFGLFFRRKYN